MVIREVQPADAELWGDLSQELWPHEDRAGIDVTINEFFAGASAWVTTAFIAFDDSGTALGFLELNLRSIAAGAGASPVPHVEAWFVVPAARRLGTGRKLMAAAEEWALAHGYHELTSDTTDDYPLSIAAHSASGFQVVERLIALHKSLA